MSTKLVCISSVFCLAIFDVSITGQNAGGRSARDLFYDPSEPASKAGTSQTEENNQPLGLRYAILKRVSGDYKEVAPQESFRTSDEIRLRINVNQPCYLYVVHQDPSYSWYLLYPDPKINNGSNVMVRGRDQVIPAASGASFTFEGQPGDERLFLLASKVRIKELDDVAANKGARNSNSDAQRRDPAQTTEISNVRVDRLREQFKGRDLIYSSAEDQSLEKAVYVVNPAASPNHGGRIAVDLKLVHK